MRKSFLYLLMSVVTFVSMGTLNSCKDYEEDLMRDFNSKLAIENATIRDLLEKCHQTCEESLNALRSELQGDLSAAVADLEEADRAILRALDESCENIYKELSEIEKQFIEVNRQLKALETENEKLNGIIADIQTDLDYFESELGKVAQKAAGAYTKADSVGRELDKAKELYDEAIEDLGKRADNLDGAVLVLDSKIKELQNIYGKFDEEIREAIDFLQEQINALNAILENVEQSQKSLVTSIELNATVNPIFGTFNLPADVRSNVLIGYYGKALNGGQFPSAVSDGYYMDDKNAMTDADFEMVKPSTYFDYKSGDILVNGGETLNIGTLYLTVNPTKADFTGTEFELVNSNDETALVKLGNLQPSDYKIQFGYSRAVTTDESKNGFYESQVSIAKSDVEDAAIHPDGLIDAAKGILNKLKSASASIDRNGNVSYNSGSELNVSELATTLLDNMSGITDAYAVRASWNDELIGDERSVYSQYGLAATAVQSFTGYSSFKDFNFQNVVGYEKAMNFIDRMAGSIKKQIHDAMPNNYAITKPTFEQVTWEFDDEKYDQFRVVIDVAFELQEGFTIETSEDNVYLKVYDQDGNVVGQIPFQEIRDLGNGKYQLVLYSDKVDFTDAMRDIVESIKEAIDSTQGNVESAVDQLLSEVNALLKDINGIEDKIDTSVDKFASQLQRWLSRINSRVVNFINSANYRLQPFLVATNDLGTQKLSTVKNYPTVIPTATELILTNYTGEILAPALKKYVACTNVFKSNVSAQGGNGACRSALKAVNGNVDMNQVLDGSVVTISVDGFQSGYTYELTLAALDYDGKQTARKFYVTVE